MLKILSEANNINLKTNVINPNNPLVDLLEHKITTTMHLVIIHINILETVDNNLRLGLI